MAQTKLEHSGRASFGAATKAVCGQRSPADCEAAHTAGQGWKRTMFRDQGVRLGLQDVDSNMLALIDPLHDSLTTCCRVLRRPLCKQTTKHVPVTGCHYGSPSSLAG